MLIYLFRNNLKKMIVKYCTIQKKCYFNEMMITTKVHRWASEWISQKPINVVTNTRFGNIDGHVPQVSKTCTQWEVTQGFT